MNLGQTVGRRRSRDFGLPPRMHRKREAYYYVTNGKPRQWIPLGSDLNHARRLWADLEFTGEGETVEDSLTRYTNERAAEWSERTRKQYRHYAKSLTAEFGSLELASLSTPMLDDWQQQNRHRKAWINGCLALLTPALAGAVRRGVIASNPALNLERFEGNVRERYLTDKEFVAIRSAAPQWLKDAMTLAYFTAMRESDVVALRWSAVSDVIAVEQKKTGKRQEFIVTPHVRRFLDSVKARPILGLFVIATNKGRPITEGRLQRAFKAACGVAKVTDATFHDIRGKAATDAKADGQDYQALLGHSSKRQSDAYVKAKEVTRVEPLRRVL